jgi:hypothetical protein
VASCEPPSCHDAVQDGTETALDCGGAACPPCPPSAGCKVDADCRSGHCLGGSCAPPAASCSNGVQDGQETATDCGGAECSPCLDLPGNPNSCLVDADCTTDPSHEPLTTACIQGFCHNRCRDGVQDNGETDVDCGGPCTRDWNVFAGSRCPNNPLLGHWGCAVGQHCNDANDCSFDWICSASSSGVRLVCLNRVCTSSCADGVQDNFETDVDCGRSVCDPDNPQQFPCECAHGCDPCAVGKHCKTRIDCVSGYCVNGICAAGPSDLGASD